MSEFTLTTKLAGSESTHLITNNDQTAIIIENDVQPPAPEQLQNIEIQKPWGGIPNPVISVLLMTMALPVTFFGVKDFMEAPIKNCSKNGSTDNYSTYRLVLGSLELLVAFAIVFLSGHRFGQ